MITPEPFESSETCTSCLRKRDRRQKKFMLIDMLTGRTEDRPSVALPRHLPLYPGTQSVLILDATDDHLVADILGMTLRDTVVISALRACLAAERNKSHRGGLQGRLGRSPGHPAPDWLDRRKPDEDNGG